MPAPQQQHGYAQALRAAHLLKRRSKPFPLNFLASSPLAGPHDKRWGERFVDMARAYDPRLRRATLKAARPLRLKCFEGVYAALPGAAIRDPCRDSRAEAIGS